jgi:hypothetical protein
MASITLTLSARRSRMATLLRRKLYRLVATFWAKRSKQGAAAVKLKLYVEDAIGDPVATVPMWA